MTAARVPWELIQQKKAYCPLVRRPQAQACEGTSCLSEHQLLVCRDTHCSPAREDSFQSSVVIPMSSSQGPQQSQLRENIDTPAMAENS